MNRFACIVDAVYPLYLYLLCRTMEEIRNTVFIVGRTIPKDVARALGSCVYATDYEDADVGWRRRSKIRARWLTFFCIYLRYVRGRCVFAQDHLTFSSRALCGSRYTLLEDAPGTYCTCYKSRGFEIKPVRGLKEHLKALVYDGALKGRIWGTNGQCVNRLVTRAEDLKSELFVGRAHELLDLDLLWRTASDEKRAFICRVFGVTPDLIALMSARDTVIYTQPFKDFGMSSAEIADVFREQVDRLGATNVLVKPHPRDRTDYTALFPGVAEVRTVAPMQLLNQVCRPPRRAITVCSTAIYCLPKSTEIVWLGTKVNPKIVNWIGVH